MPQEPQAVRQMVVDSSAQVVSAIEAVPDDNAFVSTADMQGNTSAHYAHLVAEEKALMSESLGSTTVPPVPPSFSSKSEAISTINAVEADLENAIVRLKPDDFDEDYPEIEGVECPEMTVYECLVAHSDRDEERANSINAIFRG